MKQRILTWWHKRRGYHAAHPEISRGIIGATLKQVCSCGAERETRVDLEPGQSVTQYEYYWAA